MRLLKLEVCGFKSFADRTVFEFQPGLTAFVGPNGCGKSNVVDAVKWVLGEQSAKSLRGSEMTDVIFNGAAGRKSLGFAEASLHVLNDDRALPIDYEEVRITRRLYRSGESEYLINNQPCRLRDIRELFMDTGIGMDAYSLIEQGKVDVLISANSHDRRAIFEEAAGISKFKAQKKQALAKLERVEQNLLRLGDIIDEVERQLRSVKRQAGIARRYKEVADQLRQARIDLALHRYDELIRSLDDARRRIADAADQRQMITGRIEALDAEKVQLDASALELDKTLARLQNADVQLQGQFRSAEDAIRFHRERIQELQHSEQKLANEVASIRRHLGGLKHDLLAALDEIEQIREDVGCRTEQLQQLRSEAHHLAATCTELARQVDEQRTVVLELMRLMSHSQNELTSLSAERRGLQSREERLQERQQQIASELGQVGIERTAAVDELDRLRNERTTNRQQTEDHLHQRDDVNRRAHGLADRLAAQREELTSLLSHKEVLEDLEQKREGLGAGARYVLEESHRDGGALDGIVGVIADLLDTDLCHAVAVEAALGDAVQHLVAHSFDHAVAAVRHLRDTDRGRASFVAMDRLRPRSMDAPSPAHHPGLVGRARDLLRCDPAVEPVFDSLLGWTLVVDGLDRAVAMSSNGLSGWRLVTLEGEVIEPGGAVAGGQAPGCTGLITRKAELHQVDARVAVLRDSVAQIDDELVQCSHQRDTIEVRIEELRDRASELAVAISQRTQQIERLDDTVRRLSDEQAVGRSELDEMGGRLEEIVGKEDRLRQDIDRIRADEAAAEARANELAEQRQQAEGRRGQLDEAATELKVCIAQRTERRESLEAAALRIRQSLQDLKGEMLGSLDEIDQCGRRRADSLDTIRHKEQDLAGITRHRDELHGQQVDAANRREEVRCAADANAARAKEARAAMAQADKQLHDLELQEHDLRNRLEDLAARVLESHEANLAELHQDYAPPDDADWAAVEAQADQLQQRLKSMGSVNLNAIHEQEELENRASFLTAQRDDLEKSRQQLMEVIRKINRQSREMFEQTFHAIREHFQQTFRKLFGGGRADIILEEGVDILEAGVDIIARPPGKEPRSITLLSGGEKSLTAVALLFAIFRSKPSPFCILDEVDAALDEDNTDRFVSMVREFLQSSQFIVVTHSRRTMSMADALYGITMQDAGVSKKVSVKLAAAGHKVA